MTEPARPPVAPSALQVRCHAAPGIVRGAHRLVAHRLGVHDAPVLVRPAVDRFQDAGGQIPNRPLGGGEVVGGLAGLLDVVETNHSEIVGNAEADVPAGRIHEPQAIRR